MEDNLMKKMKFIEPKNRNLSKVDWKVSDRTRAIVKYYAEYTEFTEEEIVDEFLTNILLDPKFREWIENRRYNKRILSQIFDSEDINIG